MPRLPLLALAALVLTVSGCGSDSRVAPEAMASPTARPQDGQRERRAEPEPEPDSPTATPSDRSAPPKNRKRRTKPLPVMGQPLHRSALESHLLSSSLMPAPGETVWTRTADRQDPAAVGACQKTGLDAIGAVHTLRRTFTSGQGGAVATQVVGEFADPKSAWRAHEVLRAWQADCEERLGSARAEVGPLRSVVVRAGEGEGYRAASAERGWASGVGILRRGSHLSVVELRTAPSAYPSERDPARMAVRRIARTFA